MNPNQNDPVIDEIREIRHRISQQFDHNPSKLVAYYMELQTHYPHRLAEPASTTAAEEDARARQEFAGELSRS